MASEKNSSTEKPADQHDRAFGDGSVEDLDAMNGLLALVQSGLTAREEKKVKNRTILGLFICLILSLAFNTAQYLNQPEPKLLGLTPDGRTRPLPLLDEPIYSHKEILVWATKCVESVYRLSYVDWETTINNNTFCMADASRKNFAESLKKIGVLQYLTRENQGNIYAVASVPEMRKYAKNDNGYYEWIVTVPYRIYIDGKTHGTSDVIMTMKVRRVPMTWREDGLWVESYVVRPRSSNDGR